MHILLKGEYRQSYNSADADSNISIRELAETIAKIGNRQVVIDVPDRDEKKGFNVVTKSVFSTEKLESLGWKALSGMIIGLNHIIQELR